MQSGATQLLSLLAHRSSPEVSPSGASARVVPGTRPPIFWSNSKFLLFLPAMDSKASSKPAPYLALTRKLAHSGIHHPPIFNKFFISIRIDKIIIFHSLIFGTINKKCIPSFSVYLSLLTNELFLRPSCGFISSAFQKRRCGTGPCVSSRSGWSTSPTPAKTTCASCGRASSSVRRWRFLRARSMTSRLSVTALTALAFAHCRLHACACACERERSEGETR